MSDAATLPATPCAVCGQPATGEHTYHEWVICADCAARSAAYERRREDRVERLEARADRARQDANATAQRATEMASRIPFGQPMMPDHHSYGRDQRYRERIDRLYGQAHRTWQDADRRQRRAEAAAENTAVSSDDPLAVLKLEEQLAAAERSQARMKGANAIIRKWLATAPDTCRAELAALGLSETAVEAILHPRFESKPGFPSYALRNNNATIRRLKERIAELRARREQAAADPDVERAAEVVRPGLTVVRNVAANRLQLIFDEKPAESVRAVLKAHGWRWARSEGAWQRHLNAGSQYALERTLQALEDA